MRREHVARPAAECLMLLGCLKVPQESASLSAMDATEVTATELQMRVYEAGRRISFVIENAADTIAFRSADPDVRRRTLRWKLAAIPQVEEASLRIDPVVAAADLWALTMQLSAFLRRGEGRAAFGEYQPLAIAATDTLEKIAAEVAGRLRPGGRPTAKDEQSLRTWSDHHPIQDMGMGRESILSTDWKVLSLTETSLTGTVASIQRSLAGVTNRMGYLNEGIFKRVIWQAQLAAYEVVPPLLEQGKTALLGDLSAQQGKVFDAITEQRIASFAALTGERQAVLLAFRGERMAVLDAMRSERSTVLEALRVERVATIEALTRERIATLATVDSMMQRSIDHAGAVAGRLLLLTFVGLTGFAVAGGFVAAITIRAWRTRS
jgi:hypothetical protein